MNDVVDCLDKVTQALDSRDLRPGALTHVIAQLQTALDLTAQGLAVRLERSIQATVTSPTGVAVDIDRIIDIVSRGIAGRVHTEIKTGGLIGPALDTKQLVEDAILAMKRGVANVWEFTNITFNERTLPTLQRRIEALATDLLSKGFSEKQVQKAIESFHFEDKVGEAFKPAISFTFDKKGPIAKVALEEASGSPDFGPSMEVLFGPHGKVAAAASAAVTGTNLAAASEGLEKKLESSVKSALDEAGDRAAAHAGRALASKIGEGATALGNIFTAGPQLYSAVEELGEVWDKPLQSTEDYMNLFSKLGGALSQGVQTVQALAGVTKIAAAAQAVFNAVMAMNPIVLIVIAVIALVALIAALVVYWDQVKAAVRDNPWVAAIGVIFGPLGILISLIVLVIAYWDELKLAVLKGANFISIKVQQIGAVFVGLKNLIGMVWDWIVTSVYNLGVGILNSFIGIGVKIMNFFIDLVNDAIGVYNRVVKYIPGVSYIGKIEPINPKAHMIAERAVPQVDMAAAFAGVGQVTGGLEGQIAKQEEVVRKAKEADEERRRQAREQAAAPAAPTVAPGAPGLPAMLPTAGLAAPAVPLAGAGAVAAADHSVHVEGGIHITITAERLEADSAKLFTDEMVRRLQERLDALRMERERRLGTRAPAPA